MAGSVGRQLARALCSRVNAKLSSSASLQGQRTQRLHDDHHPNIVRSDYSDVVVPNMALHEYVFNEIGRFGKKICVQCSYTGRTYSYDDILRKSRNLGRALRKKVKMQRGDVVGLILPNCPEYPIAVLGSLAGGAVVTLMNPMYTAEEIKRQILDSGTKYVITLSELYPAVQTAIGTSIPVITINDKPGAPGTPQGAINFNELADSYLDAPDFQDCHVDDIAVMPYSSGTTGLPKGVCLSHKNLLTNVCQVAHEKIVIVQQTEGDKQEIVPAVLPLFHIFGFTNLLLSGMTAGAKILTMAQFEANLYTKILLERKPTVLFVVPPIVTLLSVHPAITKKHLESVRIAVSGAAPLSTLVMSKFQKKVGNNVKLIQGFGMSETSPVVMIQPHAEENPAGSVGKLIPNIMAKILPVGNSNGEPLGPNQAGECYVKGGNIMLGYHNRPKETEDTLINGWLRTGDLFYYDEAHHFYITGRIKELIKVKGFQVSPAELEEILRKHPDVGDAAVIGIPNEIFGEVPRAYVVPTPNKQINIAALNAYVDTKVVEYKRLRGGIEVLETIPKSAAGKTLRKELQLKHLGANN